MTTHLTKIWWDLNKHKLVEQAIPEAEIYKREWVGLTDEDKQTAVWTNGTFGAGALWAEAKLKEKNNG